MTSILRELGQAARGLLRNPGYSAGVLLTLALGIGSAAAVFALVDGVLLQPLPYADSDRLVLLREQNVSDEWNTSVADFRAVRETNRSFEGVAAMRSMDVIVSGEATPEWVGARLVTAGYFDVLGVKPARGRGFLPGEDEAGAAPVVVLARAFAERRFGAGVDPLGRTLTIDGVAHTVVGIMPPGVERLAGLGADLWPAMRLEEPVRRGPFLLNTIARLKPGLSVAQATADTTAISRQIFPRWQEGFQDESARIIARPLKEVIVGKSARFLWVAFAAVLAVLLIAVVNIANLVLMRATERMQDLSVRAALGAGTARLARFLVTESVLLAAAGGLAGIGLAAGLLRMYRALGPELPRLAEVAIDGRVLAFAAAVVLGSGLFFGIVPLLFVRGDRLTASERLRAAGGDGGRSWLRNGLVTLEFALALPLLVAAGLLINSLVHLQRVDPGFEAGNLLTARVRLPDAGYPDDAARLALWDELLAELAALPGVEAVGLASGIPPDSPWTVNNFDLVSRPAGQGSQPMSPWTPVSAGFLGALGVPLVEGRGFDTRDRPDGAPVLLVSKGWAERFFPGESAVGKQLYEGGDVTEPLTIVGVTGDVKFAGLDQPAESVYAPISQGWPSDPAYLYLRTRAAPLSIVPLMRATLERLDAALVPTEVTTMTSHLRDSLGDERHRAAVIVGFALAAVLLAAVGVSGVLACFVSRQHREIGIRLALGADAGRISGMIVKRGLVCAVSGVVIGTVLSLFVTRSLDALLFGVGGSDFITLVGASVLLLSIALAASWLPARRAARVDAMVALRAE